MMKYQPCVLKTIHIFISYILLGKNVFLNELGKTNFGDVYFLDLSHLQVFSLKSRQ